MAVVVAAFLETVLNNLVDDDSREGCILWIFRPADLVVQAKAPLDNNMMVSA